MSLKERFSVELERKLAESQVTYVKCDQVHFGNLTATTYCTDVPSAVVDVLDNECYLTRKGRNFVFEYDDDEDCPGVAEDVVIELLRPVHPDGGYP